jgi:ABC-2 type transport system ATP-binding protein
MTAVVAFEGVRKTYGKVVAVDRVDWTVTRGSFVGLIGHNGAGKSTCLKMLMGTLLPTEGRVLVDGIDVSADPIAARARLGAVPEEPAVYPYLTGREFLEYVAAVRGRGDPPRLLREVGLDGDGDRLAREYSQGMRRKLALAAALLAEPPVLLLDEALNGLDPPSAAQIKALLRDRVDAGATVVLSTHVVETVEQVADRVVMLAHGRVVADERTADLAPGALERLFLDKLRETRDAGRPE